MPSQRVRVAGASAMHPSALIAAFSDHERPPLVHHVKNGWLSRTQRPRRFQLAP